MKPQLLEIEEYQWSSHCHLYKRKFTETSNDGRAWLSATASTHLTMPSAKAGEAQQSSSKSYTDAAVSGVEKNIKHANYETNEVVKHISIDPPVNPTPNGIDSSVNVNGSTGGHPSSTELVVERYDVKNGERLVSIRSQWHDKQNKSLGMKRRNSELLSGRRAGARWDQRQVTEIQPSLRVLVS